MPKRREVDFVVPQSPAEVQELLKPITRWSLMPHRGSPLGKGGLQGTHSETGFKVADDTRVMIRSLRAVANCTMEERAQGGTRIHGVVGLPNWVTWSLRLSTLMVPIVLAIAGWQLVAGGGLAAVAGPIGMALMLVLAVFSVGRLVAGADEGVDPLVDRLLAELSAEGSSTTTERAAARHPRRQTEG